MLSAVLLAGCGSDTAAGPSAPASPAAATASPTAVASAVPAGGTWTSPVPLVSLFTDDRIVVGLTEPDAGTPVEVVALSAADGTDLWTAQLPAPPEAQVTDPTLRYTPGAPIVASWQQELPASGLDPAERTGQVAAFDPTTGELLWNVAAGGPAGTVSPTAVLVAADREDDPAGDTIAFDPKNGKQLWTSKAGPVLVRENTAVLTESADGGGSTLLTGVDAGTGQRLWSSKDWAPDAISTQSFAHAAVPGRLLVETTVTVLGSEPTELRVRDIRTGKPVGPALPEPNLITATVDQSTATVLVYEDTDSAGHGVYAVDAATGTKLWGLEPDQSTAALIAGQGLTWLEGADGAVAVDTRTGKVRAQGLPETPVLVLPDSQILSGADGGLRAVPLP